MRTKFWINLTTEDISKLSRNTIIIVPFSAIEQHGPHLPLGTDKIILDKIKSYKHIETYIEDSTINTLTYDKNNATVLQGNGLGKDAFYEESGVVHWATNNHCDVNVK